MAMDRRDFLKGGVLVSALGAGAMLGLTGCGQTAGGEASSDGKKKFDVVETVDTDIVVVGAGIAGIAAATQAGENGDKVVLLEWNNKVGGAGMGVEGVFGWNSPLQQEQGITFDVSEIVSAEVAGSNYESNPLFWKDLVENSGDNIAWMIKNGVEFSGIIDGYPIEYPNGNVAGGLVDCFHWFGGGSAYEGFEVGGNCYKAYVQKLELKMAEFGVDIRTNHRGTNLVFDEAGKVAGVYAQNADEKYIQINAKAVIIATGGIGNDAERLKMRGMNPDRVISVISPGSSGDGAKMAIDEAGAREYLKTAYEGNTGIPGTPRTWSPIAINMGFGGPVLWVNEYAERFTNENIGATNFALSYVPRQNYKEQYVFVTKKHAYDVLMKGDADMIADWERRVEEDPDNVWEGETVEAVAEAAGLDPVALRATVDRYNELCRSGKDVDFGKEADQMIEQVEGPFLLYATFMSLDSSFGTICTDRSFRAVDVDNKPIDGLYAVGVDGCMLYSGVYTIDVPGSGCANSVNSGRVAANHAHGYIA